MEKGKAESKNSPTLNDQYVRDMLGKVMRNGEYDENVVKVRVKRIDIYENRMIICYVKEGEINGDEGIFQMVMVRGVW